MLQEVTGRFYRRLIACQGFKLQGVSKGVNGCFMGSVRSGEQYLRYGKDVFRSNLG